MSGFKLKKAAPKKKVFGLQLRGSSAKKQTGKSSGSLAPSVFGGGDEEDSEEETVNQQILNMQMRKAAEKKVQKERERALAQDSSVFDYDGVFDDLQAKKHAVEQEKLSKKRAKESKYIGKMVAQAEFRKKEQDLIFNKNQIKERSKEDHKFEDKEKFVTSAYKAKLQEDEKWKREQEEREKRDKEERERKGGAGGFLSNILDLRTGGATGARETSEVEDREKEIEKEKERERERERKSSRSRSPRRRSSSRSGRERSRERSRERGRSRRSHSRSRSRSRSRSYRHRSRSVSRERERERERKREREEKRGLSEEMERVKREREAEAKLEEKRKEEMYKRRNDETSVMSAKERYLARKKAKQQSS